MQSLVNILHYILISIFSQIFSILAEKSEKESLKKLPSWFRHQKMCTCCRSKLWSGFLSSCFYLASINCVSLPWFHFVQISNYRSLQLPGSIALAASNSTEPYVQPKIEEMNYVLFTESENVSIPITESIKLWKHEKFDPNKNVVIMVTGWNTDIDEENAAAGILGKAYLSRGDTNFILIDTARYVDTLYAWSAFNTQELGKGLGTGLAELIKVVPLEKIHVMGHSLGYELCFYLVKFFRWHFIFERAHIVGSAGKAFQEKTEKLLPRITGNKFGVLRL